MKNLHNQDRMRPGIHTVAILGTQMPRQCGIATFSGDLAQALGEADPTLTVRSIAMSDTAGYEYPSQVEFEIAEGDEEGYAIAADLINQGAFDILSVQHEYGIFGGRAGSYLMNLVREVKIPIVTTLHTVLQDPNPAQKAVMDELMQLSERVVVMSEKAVGLLRDVHGVPIEKTELIPHGIPTILPGAGARLRADLGIEGPMILTFGLLSPDKGIEHVIQAMPEVLASCPGATYVVVGATHPHIRASAGEVYRRGLEGMVAELGLGDRVRFVNRFVEKEELVEYLAAMDIYITPYLKPAQITSGTLAYAVGAGKAVISTPYWYAEELLDDGRGILVPFRDKDAIAGAVIGIQADEVMRTEMGRKAAEFGAQMLWPEVGNRYLETFTRAQEDNQRRLKSIVRRPYLAPEEVGLPEFCIKHLLDLSDDTGILQHATYSIPNRDEGYCVDDNARALILTTLLEDEGTWDAQTDLLQGRYLSFLLHAFNPENGRFRNFMSFGREWLEDQGSEDSHGRSLWALGCVLLSCQSRGRRQVARNLFCQALPALMDTTSPRTWAYGILALDKYLRVFPLDPDKYVAMESLADRLNGLYQLNQREDWLWYEQSLTYGNARIPQAMILAGERVRRPDLLEVGLQSLGWLEEIQTSPEGSFAPIGTDGFYGRGSTRQFYDQQPIEASASVSASLCAWRITHEDRWRQEAMRAFEWFTGRNMLGLSVCVPETGGCHDGLHPLRLNFNQGAESTLAYLSALTEMRAAHPAPAFVTLQSKP